MQVDELHLAERKEKYSMEELRRKTMEKIQQGQEGIHIYIYIQMAQQMEIKRREEQEYIYRRKMEKNWRDYRSQQENGAPPMGEMCGYAGSGKAD